MTIGLIDVDGHNFPNLALMKLSAYHKAKGDSVEWYSVFEEHYDIVYMAKVFTHTEDYRQVIINADRIIRGGTGYDVHSRLPEEAEKITPDYSLYPFIDDKTAYGFLTRGCIRKCPWCVVPRKEGNIHPYQDVDEIAVNGRTNLILMDNNILAAGDYGITLRSEGTAIVIPEHSVNMEIGRIIMKDVTASMNNTKKVVLTIKIESEQ